jgi:hypothetical protein
MVMKKLPTEFRNCLNPFCKKQFECRITSKQKYCSVSCASKEKIRSCDAGFKKGHKCWTEGLTKETDSRILKMSNKSTLTRKGIHFTKKRGNQFGANNPMYGKKHTEETKKKIGAVHRNKVVSKDTRELMRLNNLGCKNPMYGKQHSEETINKLKKINNGRVFSKELLKKMSDGQKKVWQNDVYAKKMIKLFHMSPNKTECCLMVIIELLLPDEYKFVGDGAVVFGGKCPDYINITGKNKIIELFGDYWHGKKKTGKENFEVERERIDHFYKHGYQTLIVWEHELKNTDKLKQKIIDFNCIK